MAFSLRPNDASTSWTRHGDLKHIYGEAPVALESAASYFEKQLHHAEQALQDGRPFLVGGRFTTADMLLTTCLTWAKLWGAGTSACSRLSGEDYVSSGAPRRRLAANPPGGMSRLSLCSPLCLSRYGGAREIGLRWQMSGLLASGPGRTFNPAPAMSGSRIRSTPLPDRAAAQIGERAATGALFVGHMDIAQWTIATRRSGRGRALSASGGLTTRRVPLVGHFDEHKLVDELLKSGGGGSGG